MRRPLGRERVAVRARLVVVGGHGVPEACGRRLRGPGVVELEVGAADRRAGRRCRPARPCGTRVGDALRARRALGVLEREHREEAELPARLLDEPDGARGLGQAGAERPLERGAAARVAEEVEADGGLVARLRLDVGDRRRAAPRAGTGMDGEGGVAQARRAQLAAERRDARGAPVRLDHGRVADDAHAGVARLDPAGEVARVELGGRDPLRGAVQAAHAVEDVAVGVEPADEVGGGRRGAVVDLRLLAPVAGVGDEHVRHDRGEHDHDGEEEPRGGGAAAARRREPPAGRRDGRVGAERPARRPHAAVLPRPGHPRPAAVRARTALSAFIASAMIERYTRPEIGAVWTDEARMTAWRDVEVAAAEALDGPSEADLQAIRTRDVHRRGGQGARAGHGPRRRRLRRRARRLGRRGRALDPLRADLLRRARHGAGAAAAPRGRRDRPRRPRAGRRAGRARARARGHAVRRPHPRRARRADDVRPQARRLRVRGAPQRRAAGARVRAGRDRRDLRRRRHLRDARARRTRRACSTRSGWRPSRSPPRSCRATATPRCCRRSRSPARGSSASRPRSATSSAPRCARSRSRSARARRARARCRTSATRSRRSGSPGLARVLRGYAQAGAGGRRPVARARHLALGRRARDPARRDDRARLHAAPGAPRRAAA